MKLTDRIRTSPKTVYINHYAGEGGQWFLSRHGTKYVRAFDLDEERANAASWRTVALCNQSAALSYQGRLASAEALLMMALPHVGAAEDETLAHEIRRHLYR